MASSKSQRKLVAILFADIVGYTALMQNNESLANQHLDKFHSILQAKVSLHRGKVINNYGDGCVCTFDSSVDAVHCAKEVQMIFQTKPKVPVRLGLHSGDVFFKDDNVYGDGVNIASRIESLGIPGAVLISERVKKDIANQQELKVQSLGLFDFKNVEKKLEVFGLANKGLVIPQRGEMKGKVKLNGSESFLAQRKGRVLLIFIIFIIVSAIIYNLLDSVGSSKAIELSPNITAVDYYLKGELHHKKVTLSDIDTAIVYYKKAIESDPNFAKAYNRLGSAYMRKYLSFDPNTKWEEEAYSAAGKAILKDPDLANPHLIRGQFYWSKSHNFAHEDAIYEFLKAIEKDPNLSEAYEQLALVQLHIGLFDDALKNAQKSIHLDPGNFFGKTVYW